eukprot:TRINITY_DN15736_c0_g1_i1.p1 TRINITY_DN15736_c0_g1~~TRINITY_DN15736_c0_g1_i1.p1  ORF type:complete len:652 (-),score=132.62 TRINITY_DN15736_c0_g1_i1:48-2003(-)
MFRCLAVASKNLSRTQPVWAPLKPFSRFLAKPVENLNIRTAAEDVRVKVRKAAAARLAAEKAVSSKAISKIEREEAMEAASFAREEVTAAMKRLHLEMRAASRKLQEPAAVAPSVAAKPTFTLKFKNFVADFPTTFRNLPALIVRELKHYWHGSKLLAADIRIATRLLFSMLNGRTLTWREHRQLKRTVADMFRLVPFIIIVIVPFMEFALPIFLKLFPNMLPSTFEDKLKKEETLKKKLRLKLDLAKFLQDTLQEMSSGNKTDASAAEFQTFMKNVRDGQYVSNEEIVKFTKLFENEFTLDSLPRPQLVAMSRYIDLSPYGPDAFLRYQLRQKLTQLRSDDERIMRQGVESLSVDELASTLRHRGMRVDKENARKMRQQLRNWLDLSLDKKLPSSLLILSRAFLITGIEEPSDVLRPVLGALPTEFIQDAIDNATATDAATKLERLKDEETLIAEEMALQQQMAAVSNVSGEIQSPSTEPVGVLEDLSPVIAAASKPELVDGPSDHTLNRLKDISGALEVLASESAVEKEREDLQLLQAAIASVAQSDTAVDKPTRVLSERLQSTLSKLNAEIDRVDKKIGHAMHVLRDADNDGAFTVDEVEEAAKYLKVRLTEVDREKVAQSIDRDKDNRVTLEDIKDAADDDTKSKNK